MDCEVALILLVNGAFGIGKTTVARAIVRQLRRAVLFDPEWIGIALQRVARVSDFQDLRSWRRLTIATLRLVRLFVPNVVVPMAFSNAAYLEEIRAGILKFEPRLFHVCLVAPLEAVHDRLRMRGANPTDHAWEFRRAAECCAVHQQEQFATHVRAEGREPEEIAREILALL